MIVESDLAAAIIHPKSTSLKDRAVPPSSANLSKQHQSCSEVISRHINAVNKASGKSEPTRPGKTALPGRGLYNIIFIKQIVYFNFLTNFSFMSRNLFQFGADD